MSLQRILAVRLYRQTPGDTGNKNIPLPPCYDLPEYIKKAGAILLAHRSAPSLPPAKMVPHRAQVIDRDNNVLATIQAVPGITRAGETFEIVPAPQVA